MNPIRNLLGQTDIYLIDQIFKERFRPGDCILDAGCGSGRNLTWFVQNDMRIFGVDQDEFQIGELRKKYPDRLDDLLVSDLKSMPLPEDFFDHIISCAVLHFAQDLYHFHSLFAEHIRVLRPQGSFFIRMTSDIGLPSAGHDMGEGVFRIPDGSTRFLLTRNLIEELMAVHHLTLLEPIKTTNVEDVRAMTTLVFQKG